MDGLEPWLLFLAVATSVGLALRKAFLGSTSWSGPRTRRRAPTTPSVFSYWYALVPFDDGDGAKERPVLVLRLEGTTAEVLKVTSKAKPGRTNYRRIETSHWDRPGRREGSWLRTDQTVTLPVASFRRWLGDERNVHFTRELTRLHPDAFDEPRG